MLCGIEVSFMATSLRYHLAKLPRGIAARLAAGLFIIVPAQTAQRTPVNIELLLALDASASVDHEEFELELQGIARAFRDPDVLAAMENLRPFGVAVGVSQWGGPGDSRMIIPFTQLTSARDAKAYGYLIGRSYRFIGATSTSIVTAIEDGVALLQSNSFDGQRLVIDISGDGQDNSGMSLKIARQEARDAGVTINGLPIEADEQGLGDYYRDNVISGADSFVIKANDFEDFARAIREKLLRELRPLGS
jgi:Protein of unknown function (DUF1194)